MNVLYPLPIALPAGSITFPAATTTPIAVAAQPQIRNTESVGVLIDKFIFDCRTINSLGTSTVLSAAGVSIMVEIRWHNELITNSFVPIGAVAWPQNRATESLGQWVISLKKPMYLAPNDYIDVIVRNDFIMDFPHVVVIRPVAVGHQCAAPPAERWVPFLSSYMTQVYPNNSGNLISDQSGPMDLGNPFTTDLFIERLIGRVMMGSALNYFWDGEPSSLWSTYTLRLSDHRDNFWVATATPLPLVCNAQDRSWLLSHTLEPKGFLRVDFEGIANVADAVGTTQSRAILGTVGYRRIFP